MRMSRITALLGLLVDFTLLALTLVHPEMVVWLVVIRLALFAVQLLEVVVGRLHSKVTKLLLLFRLFADGLTYWPDYV